jgi:hypothetical protein
MELTVLCFGSVLWYGIMDTEYGTLYVQPLIFGRHVFGVKGSSFPPPPPVTCPPPRGSCPLEYYIPSVNYLHVHLILDSGVFALFFGLCTLV